MYENLASRIRFERQDTRIGALFAAGAIVLMLMAASLSLVWFKSGPERAGKTTAA